MKKKVLKLEAALGYSTARFSVPHLLSPMTTARAIPSATLVIHGPHTHNAIIALDLHPAGSLWVGNQLIAVVLEGKSGLQRGRVLDLATD